MSAQTLTVTLTYNNEVTTPDYLIYQLHGIEGIGDVEAHAPYAVMNVDDVPVAVLPNKQAAHDTARSLGDEHYVQADFTETDIKFIDEPKEDS